MSTGSKYQTIRNEIVSLPCSIAQLRVLKERYAEVINSKRRLENIKSLGDLIKVLEKRDYINCSNLQPFIDIASEFKNVPLVKSLKNLHLDNSVNQNGVNKQGVYIGLIQFPSSAKDRAYVCIADDLGQKWVDFARALGVPEGDIDELSKNVKKTSERIYKILQFHEHNCDPRRWLSRLLDALADARRNDLRKRVQEIFDVFS